MAVDFSNMTNEEIRKYYESECKDDVNWKKAREEASSNSWTDEDETKNEVFLTLFKKQGNTKAICPGLFASFEDKN